MHVLQNVEVARQLVREREAVLRAPLLVGRALPGGGVRRWLGRQMVSLGARIAGEGPALPAPAR